MFLQHYDHRTIRLDMASAAAATDTADVAAQERGHLDKLLMKLAVHELTSKEQFGLGVMLEMEPSTIRQLMCEEAVASTFAILQAWKNSRRSSGNYSATYDQLCDAYLELKRTDIAEKIRREQIRLAKEEIKQSQDEEIRWLTEQVNALKTEVNTYKQAFEEQGVVIPNVKQSISRGKEYKSPYEMITQLQEQAKPVGQENNEDKMQRAFRVMRQLRQFKEPHLWHQVSHHFVSSGALYFCNFITATTLPELVYLLSSGEAGDVTSLNVGGGRSYFANSEKPFDMFGDIDDVNTLCRGLAAMPRLSNLSIEFCELTNDGFIVICETLMSNCRQMKILVCRGNYNLTSAIEHHVIRALSALPALTICLDRCPLQRGCCVRLKQQFGDRIRVTY